MVAGLKNRSSRCAPVVAALGVLLGLPGTPRVAESPGTFLAPTAQAGPALADSEVSNPVPDGVFVPPPCRLCAAEDPGVPVRDLTVDDARRIGDFYSAHNIATLASLDSLRLAGRYGPPESARARKQVHLLARMKTMNAYSYMIHYGADPDTVWQADEQALGPAFASFSDPGIVPLVKLKRARMGRGHMCARYDLSEKMQSYTMIGDRKLSVRIDDVRIQGRTVRCLIMDLPTSLHDVVEVWLTEHVSMDVDHPFLDGPPGPYEAYILEHMHGLWVHKGGIHRPDAFVFWVTPRASIGWDLPERPLAGARIYVPHLRLKLPGFLPDIGFEDLRDVDLPQPILALDYFRGDRYPPWLEPMSMRGFKGWEGVGPLPPAMRKRFPDR